MFWRQVLFAAVAIACLGSAATAPAVAQNAEPSRIIVVDAKRIFDESLAGKMLNRWLDANRRRLSDRPQTNPDLAELVQKANNEAQEVAKQAKSGLIGEDVANQQLQSIKKKVDEDIYNESLKIQKRIDALNNANAEIENAVRPIIRQLMQEKKANLVLNKNAVFDQLDGLDVTTEVIDRLNKQLSSLKTKLPD